MEGRAYLVAKYVVDPLLKERAALLPDKPAEPAAPAPGSVSVTTPPVTAPKIEVATPPVPVVPQSPKPAAPTPAPATPAPK